MNRAISLQSRFRFYLSVTQPCPIMRSVVGSRINSSVYLCLLIIYPPDVLIILHQGGSCFIGSVQGGARGKSVAARVFCTPLKGATTGDMPL